MTEIPLLTEFALIAALGVAVSVLFARLRLPTIAGLLVAGALAGPFGLAFIRDVHDIELLSEVGVVLLLFTIGLEFSLTRLREIFRRIALGGALQVGLTALATAVTASVLGQTWPRAIFLGFVFSLSSTAIVLRALTERRELDAPHGRITVGILIFQDLCVVPMVLIVPMLGQGGQSLNLVVHVALALGKAALVVILTLLLSRLVVPRILAWVDASRSREVFLLAVLGICIGTAWLTSLAGLSLALGAFLGGLVVADTEYGHRAMGDVLPLRDAFMSIFFVSLGMLFDIRVVVAQPWLVLALAAGFLVAKGFLATLAALSLRFPARVAWLTGVGLAQFGEFGFVLVRLGQSHGVIDAETTRPLLAAGIVSMFVTPLWVRAAPHVTAGERLLAPLERLIGLSADHHDEAKEIERRDHVVIIGFGVAGRIAARALDLGAIPYVVLELNAETVRAAQQNDVPIFYGDATSAETLGHARLEYARVLVLLMNDPIAAERVVDTARRVAPDVPILMRTRYLAERESLISLGAADVVAEEVESAVEMMSRLLRQLETPRNVIEQRIREARDDVQPTHRKQTLPRARLGDQRGLADLKIESVLVDGGAPAIGSTASALDVRQRSGALIIAIRRGDKLIEAPSPTMAFEAGDVIYLAGSSAGCRRAMALLTL